jgi:hypothetical protein
LLATILAGCETPTSARYSIDAENNLALRNSGFTGIGVGAFSAPRNFDPNCRLVGPLRVADGMTHTQYIQRALLSELQLAGVAGTGAPRITLVGEVTRLDFSSMDALTGGQWAIDLTVRSSNGRTLLTQVRHSFDSGFLGTEACRQTAEAFPRAVQDLIGNTVRHSQFTTLLR